MEELQSWWEIPSIGQYVSLFRFDFKLPEIDLEELEEALLEDEQPGGSQLLENLMVALIRGCHPRAGVNEQNWEFHLRKLYNRRCAQEELVSPLSEETSFSKLTRREKVEVLYSLCFYRLESGDVPELIKAMDADALRVQSLGRDEFGNMYWYFYGTRLYKEEPSEEKKKDWQKEWEKQKKQSFGEKKRRGRPRKCKPRKSDGESEESEENDNRNYMNLDGKSRWSVICTTLEEWVNFTEKYKSSKSKHEIALFKLLSENFLPHLQEMFEEKEKKLRQKIMQLVPRRVSTRIESRKRARSERGQPNYYESNDNMSDDDFKNKAYKKERLSRNRAQRLEERNQRRFSEPVARRNAKTISQDSNESLSSSGSSLDSNESEAEEEPVRVQVPVLASSSTGRTDTRFKIHQVLTEVKMCKDAWPFLYPVDETYAPGYSDIITDPIDLSSIENKLITGAYKSLSQVDNDFRKMVTNCQLYNGQKSEFSSMAITLWRIFRKGISKLSQQQTAEPETPAPAGAPKAPEQPAATQSSSNVSVSNTVNVSQETDSLTAKPSENVGRRKKKPVAGLKALSILAKASEIALKNSHRDESTSNSESSSDSTYRPSASYSDLNIVPIRSSHPVAQANSLVPQQVDSYGALTSTSQHTQYEIQVEEQSYESTATHTYVNNYSGEGSYNSTNVVNAVSSTGVNTHYNSSDNSSGSSSETAPMSTYNGESDVNMMNNVDNQLSNMISQCNNDNMSNFMSTLIKENQGYQLSDAQNLGMQACMNVTSSTISPNSTPSTTVGNSGNSPTNSSQVFAAQSNPLYQQGLELPLSVENIQANVEVSTVDASSLGMSNFQNFYSQEASARMPSFHNTYGNSIESSKKQATIASLLAERNPSPITSSNSNNKNQRFSPVYVTVNTNQPNLVNLSSNIAQTGENAGFTQGPLTQVTSLPMQVANQNFILQDNMGTTSANSMPTLNNLCADQNGKISTTNTVNAFNSNQLSPRQITMQNGQRIMILTQNPTTQPVSAMPSTLSYLTTNSSETAPYQQQPLYNNEVSMQPSPPALENQNNASPSRQAARKINSRPPKKRSPFLEQHTISSQISPSGVQLSNTTRGSNTNLVYSQPMQVLSNPVNTQVSNMDPNQELLRNSVVMSNTSQCNPMSTTNMAFSNGGTVTTTSYNPTTYVTSSGGNLYSTVSTPQQQMQKVDNNFLSNNNQVPSFIPKITVQNGAKRFKPTTVMRGKNGQYFIVATIKDGAPASQILTTNETYSTVQQQSFTKNPPLNQSSSAPRYINVNNSLLQTLPLQNFPVKSAPVLSEVTSNQLTHFINIPQYIVATQSPTVIQQSPLYTQSISSTNQRQHTMENR